MTGGGGSRKSDLIKTIYHTVVKTYRHAPTNPEKATALLATSTGVAAINIDGKIINTALAIPKSTGNVLLPINVWPDMITKEITSMWADTNNSRRDLNDW